MARVLLNADQALSDRAYRVARAGGFAGRGGPPTLSIITRLLDAHASAQFVGQLPEWMICVSPLLSQCRATT